MFTSIYLFLRIYFRFIELFAWEILKTFRQTIQVKTKKLENFIPKPGNRFLIKNRNRFREKNDLSVITYVLCEK